MRLWCVITTFLRYLHLPPPRHIPEHLLARRIVSDHYARIVEASHPALEDQTPQRQRRQPYGQRERTPGKHQRYTRQSHPASNPARNLKATARRQRIQRSLAEAVRRQLHPGPQSNTHGNDQRDTQFLTLKTECATASSQTRKDQAPGTRTEEDHRPRSHCLLQSPTGRRAAPDSIQE